VIGPKYRLYQLLATRVLTSQSLPGATRYRLRARVRQSTPGAVHVRGQTPREALPVDRQPVPCEIHRVAGDGHDGLHDGLDSARASPGREVAPATPESRGLGTHARHHPPAPGGASGDGSVESARRASREIDARPEAQNGGQDGAAQPQRNGRPAAGPTAHLAPSEARPHGAMATKYPPRGVLHDFAPSDDDLRRA